MTDKKEMVVDPSRIGKKGYPMHPGAFPEYELPMKESEVDDKPVLTGDS